MDRPWIGPSTGAIPAIVAVEELLGRGEDVALWVSHLSVYAQGCFLHLVAVARDQTWRLSEAFLRLEAPMKSIEAGGAMPPSGHEPDAFTLVVRFADGGTASNVYPPRISFSDAGEPQPGTVVMWPGEGSGGGGQFEHAYWIWPLPPQDEFFLECEWPSEGSASQPSR